MDLPDADDSRLRKTRSICLIEMRKKKKKKNENVSIDQDEWILTDKFFFNIIIINIITVIIFTLFLFFHPSLKSP